MAEATANNDFVLVMCEQCANHIPSSEGSFFEASCARCGHRMHGWQDKSVMHTMAYSLTALIFYFPALMFPFMTMEINGVKNSATIWSGVKGLYESGSVLVAFVVLLASVIIPILKLVLLFYLAFGARSSSNAKLKTLIYRFVEAIGRWSMLDIFLLAVLVAVMKIAPWTAVKPEVGSLMFAFVVIFTMFASASFDPRLLWKDTNVKKTKN